MRLIAAMLLIFALACHRPEAVPAAVQGPKLVLHFLDQDAVLPMGQTPAQGAWAFMNMGVWDSLEIQWKEGSGACAVGRTAPDWLLLRDSQGEVHRLVLHGPGPGELRDSGEHLDPDDRDILVVLGLAWVWAWRR